MIFVLGRIFPSSFLLAHRPGSFPRPNRNDPRSFDQGSFPVRLGFNHWVTSLSVDQPGFCVWLESLPQHSCSSACIAIGIYVKRKMEKAPPAGVLPYLVSPFFVPSEYHIPASFTRRDLEQIASRKLV